MSALIGRIQVDTQFKERFGPHFLSNCYVCDVELLVASDPHQLAASRDLDLTRILKGIHITNIVVFLEYEVALK